MTNPNGVTVLIPAYNPDEQLIKLIRDIVKEGFKQILVVNDGSKPECDSIFKKDKRMEGMYLTGASGE
ncbi:glycosyltransferase [Bacillus sp. m3-13]|uniref:glycosyltransferase n=1 Tax=Bacillus sp. m3-13 TaxID=406124 RepID=UPI0001E89EB8|nr:glycosyltransferase [Bacillus sp. m3-13]